MLQYAHICKTLHYKWGKGRRSQLIVCPCIINYFIISILSIKSAFFQWFRKNTRYAPDHYVKSGCKSWSIVDYYTSMGTSSCLLVERRSRDIHNDHACARENIQRSRGNIYWSCSNIQCVVELLLNSWNPIVYFISFYNECSSPTIKYLFRIHGVLIKIVFKCAYTEALWIIYIHARCWNKSHMIYICKKLWLTIMLLI